MEQSLTHSAHINLPRCCPCFRSNTLARQLRRRAAAAARSAPAAQIYPASAHTHAGGVQLDPAAARLQRHFRTGFQHHFFARVQVDFHPGLAQPLAVHLGVAVRVHRQIVIGEKFGLARLFEGFVRLAPGQGVGEVVHGAVLVVQDMLFPVVFDVDVHILFRMKINFFLALLVFNA